MNSASLRGGNRLAILAATFAALAPTGCTDQNDPVAPAANDVIRTVSVNGGMAARTFSLVDGAKTAVVTVDGTYSEIDPATGDRTTYDAYGEFRVTLSPVPTNDFETTTTNYYTRTDVQWERWSPTVTGTVVIQYPDGDRSFSYKHSGMASYYSYASQYSTYARFTVESYMGTTSGPSFNWVDLDLMTRALLGDANLPDQGDANVSAWSANEYDNSLNMRGTYTLVDGPFGSTNGVLGDTGILTRRGKADRYRLVSQGTHIVSEMDGWLYVYEDDGTRSRYEVDAVLTTNITPSWSTTGTYSYREYTWGWYERYNFWYTTPQQFQGSVTVHYPDGDETFHVSFSNNISSGADISRNHNTPDTWRIASYYDWEFGVSESGSSPVDFVESSGWFSGTNTEKTLPATGDAYFSLYGFKGSLNMSGTYTTSRR